MTIEFVYLLFFCITSDCCNFYDDISHRGTKERNVHSVASDFTVGGGDIEIENGERKSFWLKTSANTPFTPSYSANYHNLHIKHSPCQKIDIFLPLRVCQLSCLIKVFISIHTQMITRKISCTIIIILIALKLLL